jgi:Sec-independent protein translocase protein TatA
VAFGTEILFMLMLGLVVLGPKRLQTMLGHVVRAKAELENATRGIKVSARDTTRRYASGRQARASVFGRSF